MATVQWGASYNNLSPAGVGVSAVILTAADDASEWIPAQGKYNILCDGGTTFTIQVERSTLADKSDNVLVDTQSDTDRTGLYEFVGPGFIRFVLSAITGDPVTVRITQ